LNNGRIETTYTRAKETQKMVDRMITLGKTNTLHSRRQAAAYIYKPSTVQKLFGEIAPQYEDRNGGYTRVLKLGPRRGDGSERAILELV
jgi:large subunit ribosomal protein L17